MILTIIYTPLVASEDGERKGRRTEKMWNENRKENEEKKENDNNKIKSRGRRTEKIKNRERRRKN